MPRFAAAVTSIALLAAVGAGLGTYFALGGPTHERPPPGERNAVLETAMSRGIIDGYHAVGLLPVSSGWKYATTGGDLALRYNNGCPGSCPSSSAFSLLTIEYREQAADRAHAIMRIAESRMPYTKMRLFAVTVP